MFCLGSSIDLEIRDESLNLYDVDPISCLEGCSMDNRKVEVVITSNTVRAHYKIVDAETGRQQCSGWTRDVSSALEAAHYDARRRELRVVRVHSVRADGEVVAKVG